MKFRTRLTTAFAVLTLLMISIESLHTYLSTTHHDEQVALLNFRTVSLQANNGIDMLLRQAERDMQVIARSAYLNEPGRNIASVNLRLHDFEEGSTPIDRITFLDRQGWVAADSESQDMGSRIFREAWQQGMRGVSGQMLQALDDPQRSGILFFAPVRRSPSEQPKGVVISLMENRHIRQQFEILQGDHAHTAVPYTIALLDKQGNFLYGNHLKDRSLQVPESGELPLPDTATTQVIRTTGDTLQVLTLSSELSRCLKTTWFLKISVSRHQIIADTRQRMYRRFLINAGLFSAGCLIIYLLSSRLSQPLEALSFAVQRLGEGNSTPLALLPKRSDEFALLQESLQQMSARLQESMEHLSASEEQFHALFDAMAEGVALHRVCYDAEGKPCDYRLEEVNPRYQEILGLSRDNAVGKLATEVYGVSPAPYLQEFATVVATGQPCSFEICFEPLQLHLSVSVCRIGPERFATIFSDSTARILHEETLRSTMTQLKQANEAKSRFLAVMSHEIRTPLNGITGMVQLLQDMEMSALQREFLENIDISAESLLSVINDILDFSKIEAGRMELEELPFQPCALLNDTLRVMRLRAQAKGLQLSFVCSDSLPAALTGDPHRLAQVVTNLVNNAIKFTVGGEVAVQSSARAVDDTTVLFQVEVRDSGIGMDAATQQAVFDPFIQADSSTTRKFGGTGLGLAICKQLVELMNGSISVVSSPGQGSTFSFSVPLKRAELQDAAPETAPVVTLDQPLKILVAEDQPVNQRFVAEILRKQGHTPLLANNGQEAVTLWQDESIDLVLMDIQMPVMDGLKALAVIRAAEDSIRRHTPIIALTAHAIVGDRERLLNAGFDGYLAKPLQVSKLFEEMARVLEQIGREKLR